jgi:RNA polymerase sigma-70 factor, ECF subfamily
MNQQTAEPIRSQVDAIYRTESRRIFATLIRLIGDFDLAEEAMHEAFTAAVSQWSCDGMPTNPRSWLVSTGRFKAIDTIRRRTRFDSFLPEIAPDSNANDPTWLEEEDVEDDSPEERLRQRLRLIFTCCHPALSPEAQVALTLREVCGLTTEEIASAFLIAPATLAQRIVRAKTKIRTAGIPYQVPSLTELTDRLDSVLQTIYLVFNEGYAASSGVSLTRSDLAAEAIRLGRLVVELLPDAEAVGLLALMLLQESRRTARTSSTGDLILLEDQDRSLWNQSQIAEGRELVTRSLSSPEVGSYTLQAAIAAVHSEASNTKETDWSQVVALYDLLIQADRWRSLSGRGSPIVELNRSVAVAMRDGFLIGLQSIDKILARGDLADYHLAHAARADFCRRLGRIDDARASYQQALALVKQEPERRFLQKRLRELG